MNATHDDRDVLDVLRGSLDDITMTVPVERIVAEGRAVRRRRRRLAVAAVGVTAAAGLALGAPGYGHPATAPPTGADTEAVAFTVAKRADGKVAVTWTKEQYFKDPAGLQKALREAGFPVLVKTGVFCKGPDDHTRVDRHGSGAGVERVVERERRDDGTVVFVYDPAAMPAHTQLFIGYLDRAQLAVTHGRPGSMERLVPTGVPLTCGTDWKG
ncbi:hypothetical protein ACFXAW_12350 [Streptomyces sp. NPDC059445]|uniref:hypothetical protein n=1 Tax=Streptomyces sp. NPDC059445 TaxID=3346832 RepID=UPI0036BEC60F